MNKASPSSTREFPAEHADDLTTEELAELLSDTGQDAPVPIDEAFRTVHRNVEQATRSER
jgi:hypothetical protein